MTTVEKYLPWLRQFRPGSRSQSSRESALIRSPPTVTDEGNSSSLQVLMCHFVNGKLKKQLVDVANTYYLAVSHVWGIAEWRQVRCVKGKVLASKSKAEFIGGQLSSIVGDAYFWMDILCIDQKDGDARVAVTQHIPTIFRKAARTILVRDGSGMRQCCADTLGQILEWEEFQERLKEHMLEFHRNDNLREGVLSRLWVLEEIAVSNTIQFVTCKETKLKTKYEMPVYAEFHLSEDLRNFAGVWAKENEVTAETETMRFIQAFVNNGVVTRPTTQNDEPSLFPEWYFWNAISSTRRTTKPRDYILATMPQFMFFKVPNNARRMTFTELFFNCLYRLHAIVRLMLPDGAAVPMLDLTVDIPRTVDIPEPTSLGDLVKLFHSCFLHADMVSLISSRLRPHDPEHQYNMFSPVTNHVFQLRLLGRKYPVDLDLMRNINTENVIDLVQKAITYSGTMWAAALIGDLFDCEVQAKETRRKPLFRKFPKVESKDDVLVAKIVVTRLMTNGEEARQFMNKFKNTFDARQGVTANCLEYIVRIAALISCGVGLSAFEWSKAHLCPVSIDFRDRTYLALVPLSIVSCGKRRLFLVASDEREIRFCLLAATHRSELYAACLFPQDVFLPEREE